MNKPLIVDYFDIAKKMLYRLERNYPEMVITDEDEDVFSIADLLQEFLEPELLAELKESDLGLGIMIGMITTYYLEYDHETRENSNEKNPDKNSWN